MARKSIFALEDVAVVDQEQSTADAAVETEVLAADAADQEVAIQADAIDTASSAAETAGEIKECLEKPECTEEAVPAPAAQAVAAAIEHLYATLGYRTKSQALENFEKKPVGTFKMAAEDLGVFQAKAMEQISIAQEGFFGRMLNAIKRGFTANETILANVRKASEAFKAKGSNGKTIESPGWGRIFARSGKNTMNGMDVAKVLGDYQKILRNPELAKLVSEIAKVVDEIAKQLGRGGLLSNDEAEKKIYELAESSKELFAKATAIASAVETNSKNDPSFTALDEKSVDRIADFVENYMSIDALEKADQELYDSIVRFNLTAANAEQMRLAGKGANDMRSALKFADELNFMMSRVRVMIGTGRKLAFAGLRYIKDSTAK